MYDAALCSSCYQMGSSEPGFSIPDKIVGNM